MKTFKKVLALVLVAVMVFALSACGKKFVRPTSYVRGDDEEIYEQVLPKYEEMLAAAKAAATNDERFVLYAQAEAYLLDAAIMEPTTTQNGAYTISRIAPRTIPYVQWGNDDDRIGSMVISNEFLTKEERADLLAQWESAIKGEGKYDPAAYLTGKGHTLQSKYKTTFSTAPVTLDVCNTSSQSDTEILVNCTDNLVQYNNLGILEPRLASSWEVSEDGLTYTFHLREDANWFTSEGTVYAPVVAEDFVAGLHHMMDTQAGLEFLVDGIIKGCHDYLYEGGSFANVGYEAKDEHTLVVTLEAPCTYYMTMLTYSCFTPICASFYEAQGGVYGIEEFTAASSEGKIKFGDATNVASQVYSGPYLLQKLNDKSEIVIVKNPNYYNASAITLDEISWVYDNGENMQQFYKDVCDGVYAGCGLTEASGTLKWAKEDGNFDKYSYISDTTSTTYFLGLNLNRGTFALESGAATSPKTEEQMIDTQIAMMNKNFRTAVLKALDKKTWNAVSRGEELALSNVRNMYTHPEFVKLEGDVTVGKDSFKAGTQYGELVQFYLEKMGSSIKVADGIDGWYDEAGAKAALEAAKKELGKNVTWPITLDVVYYSANSSNTAQAEVYKKSVEDVLGAENVIVNLVETTTSADYYACGYRASNGEAGNFDVFYGSGWGPDYGDPITYLATFEGNGAGYMTKVVGLF